MSYGPPQPVTPEEDTGEYPVEKPAEPTPPPPSGWRPVAYLGALLTVAYIALLAFGRAYREAPAW